MAQKFEYNDGPGNQNATCYAGNYVGQGFTPSITHNLTQVKIWIKGGGLTGTYTVEIFAASGGKPTGAALSSGTVDIATALDTAYSLVTFNMTALELVASTQYVITARCDAANNCPWSRDSTGIYGGGVAQYSANAGATWNLLSAMDQLFEEWGELPTVPAGSGGPAALLIAQGVI